MYTPLYWLEFWGGFGVSWLASAFNKNRQGSVLGNYIGFSISTGISFRPPIRYLSFDIPIFVDLIFKDAKTYPFVMLTGRIKFHPYLEWLNVNTELGFLTWSYDDVYNSFNTISFIWRVGIGFDVDLTKNISNMKKFVAEIKDKKSPKAEKDLLKQKIRQLRTAKENKEVSFESIVFEPDQDVLKEESYQILDEIAKVLIERDNIYVEIGGHTNSIGQLENELSLSVKRALAVALYLNKKGVPFNRMKVAGYGSYSLDINGNVKENNRKVVIAVIKIFNK